MIIWLASYPKSGNTWVRSMIASLLYTTDGKFNFNVLQKISQFPEKNYLKDFVKNFNDFNKIKENWLIAQEKINLSNQIKLFKTHQGKYTVGNDNFTDNKNTLGVIYIVRDPRNVIGSISNHFSIDIKSSAKFMLLPKIIGNGKNYEEEKGGIYCLLGKWNDHYRSWTREKRNLLLIRYEDLINDAEKELQRIILFLEKYLKFETNEKKNKNIIKTTNFKNLQKMESEDGFKESVKNKYTNSKVNFFHLGPENKWKNNIDKETISLIENSFKSEMKELNYL